MTEMEVLSVMQSSILVATKLAAPILLLSMIIGLIISIIQAATQINEQTITFVPKLFLIALILLLAGSWMLQTMSDFTKDIFRMMLG
ncbi:flagellar biosynthesis protein FliQ [Anaerovorax odorimutans]|uniref:flagellar biosynthesis protein FliQ n=1 Tax=Anaerovorax odorimutans TaxID=109327 RepID=UPI000418DAAE|nr:flagellar biosynthesis protein FliQ [Anaerovorax odorimutans]